MLASGGISQPVSLNARTGVFVRLPVYSEETQNMFECVKAARACGGCGDMSYHHVRWLVLFAIDAVTSRSARVFALSARLADKHDL
jgi:hypothetical protein